MRNVLFTRTDSYVHVSNAEAAVQVREAERELWDHVTRTTGAKLDRDARAAGLVAGGVPARRPCAGATRSCTTRRTMGILPSSAPTAAVACGPWPRAESAASRAAVRRSLTVLPRARADSSAGSWRRTASSWSPLTPSRRSSRETAAVLADDADDELSVIAAAVEAVWMEHDDVADGFAATTEIIAALRDPSA